ncbi:hypothetical protein D6789_01990 [Candidatus Woesearchaeota archaeon]|nr:MAG: hypothetical protein D6789_01990 [Candidatus Woesearchaeota archaeon]
MEELVNKDFQLLLLLSGIYSCSLAKFWKNRSGKKERRKKEKSLHEPFWGWGVLGCQNGIVKANSLRKESAAVKKAGVVVTVRVVVAACVVPASLSSLWTPLLPPVIR